MLPVMNQKGYDDEKVRNQAKYSAPEDERVNGFMLFVGVHWVFALQSTAFDTWIIIDGRFSWHQWQHALSNCIEFHITHVVHAIFTWKNFFVAFEIPWEKVRIVQNTAFFGCHSTHFIGW